MGRRSWWSTVALGATLAVTIAPAARGATEVYDDFDDPGYSLADYAAKWNNSFGPGEMALNDTRSFTGGRFNVSAAPFRTGADFSVFDHLKYIAISNKTFPAPKNGSVTFSSDITAETPGAFAPALPILGVYGPSGTWSDPFALPPQGSRPYVGLVREGQQAGVVMNVVDFCTGQLFDWFVSGHTAFTLIERLPTNVTSNTANCPGATPVGRDKMYTQIIDEFPIVPRVSHHVSIRFTQRAGKASVEYFFDGRRISKVDHVGIPLDRQHVPYTGTYPSLGPGEDLGGKISGFSIGHGLFSLVDAFPFQHPESPELSVSIPVGDSTIRSIGRARLFGQGAKASFDNFTVDTSN